MTFNGFGALDFRHDCNYFFEFSDIMTQRVSVPRECCGSCSCSCYYRFLKIIIVYPDSVRSPNTEFGSVVANILTGFSQLSDKKKIPFTLTKAVFSLKKILIY